MKLISKNPGTFFILGFFTLLAVEVLAVYYIMPMPGSQNGNHVELSYTINRNIWPPRILSTILMLASLWFIMKARPVWKMVPAVVGSLFIGSVFYLTNFIMRADKMFYQPTVKRMWPLGKNQIENERLVLGITVGGESRAYPLNIIAYHHEIRDSIAGRPIIVTYCSVCRTGRVFSPIVNGKVETFRLVGMDQFNALFEDSETKSWWRQATGECVAGPLKGSCLQEIPTQQTTLAVWESMYPATLVLQADNLFSKEYNALKGFDNGTSKGGLTGTDTVAGKPKSWVIDVTYNGSEKIYEWNILKQKRIIQDTLGNVFPLLIIEPDNLSFHVFNRMVNGSVLQFAYDEHTVTLTDTSGSVWNLKGDCLSGPFQGKNLHLLSAYQEFRHSYMSFHSTAAIYKP
ncbi:MAG: DUF3179 domain-containing (seleno)protein [Chitinophagales bacterium]